MSEIDTFRDYQHKFLVIIDETEECDRAVTFAANRVKRTGGTVVLAYVISGDDFQHWLGVENVMRAEAMHDAATLLDQRARRIAEIGQIKVEKVIREGRRAEEVEKLINEDQGIAILVLAAGTSSEGPGPLVSAFAMRSGTGLRIPVTIVPGSLTDEDIAAIC
ncbi:MAG: universal stress protein [Hyphomicrobiaceae bacterium]|nr:universal stress protein [Hyphomicrobiaceae bacterium]MCC0024070.1 universal stress protein [Hyphomicrobiaceae bacterium]